MNGRGSEAIRNLADYTDEIVSRIEWIWHYLISKIFIAGSMPEYDCKKNFGNG